MQIIRFIHLFLNLFWGKPQLVGKQNNTRNTCMEANCTVL